MKRKLLTSVLVMILAAGALSGCQSAAKANEPLEKEWKTEELAEQDQESDSKAEEDDIQVRVASLKGPTTIGLVRLWKDQEEGLAKGDYEFQMMTGADEIMPRMIKGEVDIALLPANAAAVLYQKSQKEVAVIDINTLGVLYMVSGDLSVDSVEALKGKTIYLTGKGTTPDYALQYLLNQHGIGLDEVTLEYRSEAAEVAALLKKDPGNIGLLPQPFAAAACIRNEALSVVLNINEEWAALHEGQGMVTGVTVVRKEFLEEYPEAVELFMEEHMESAQFANDNIEETAKLVAKKGIIEKAEVAAKAMPACNITYIDGAKMKEMLSEYLTILFEQDPEFVGGALPGEDFYEVR